MDTTEDHSETLRAAIHRDVATFMFVAFLLSLFFFFETPHHNSTTHLDDRTYDETTPKEMITEAKWKLAQHRNNVMNQVDCETYQEELGQIAACVERLYMLTTKDFGTVAQEIPAGAVEFDPVRDFLGKGSYGVVYRGTCAGNLVAVKIPRNRDAMSINDVRLFRHEANVMARILHPNIVQFRGACFDRRNFMIVTALMSTDMDRLIHRNPNPLSMEQRLKLAYETALGMNWLHTICGMIHRDLKPANIMVDEHMVAHITDFGFTEMLRGKVNKDSGKPCGSPLYMAPEVMQCKEFDFSADVYSFGVVLFELFTGHPPYERYDKYPQLFHAVCFEHERPPIRSFRDLPEGLVRLVEECWDPDRHKRPTMAQVVDRLAVITVDRAMPGGERNPANAFWKRHFTTPAFFRQVPWTTLEKVLADTMRVSAGTLSLLRAHVAQRAADRSAIAEDFVTMEHFQHMYLWFGHWFESPGEPLVDEMAALFAAPWYHGDINIGEAAARLNLRPSGTFLVRLSAKDRLTPFTISYTKNGIVSHTRINRLSYDPSASERYSLTNVSPTFVSVNQLIDFLVSGRSLAGPCPKESVNCSY